MADYRKIVAHLPEVREYIRLRKWVHRGDSVAYGPNIEGQHLSTDGVGLRHSVFEGERLSLADCAARERYGVVLGSSNVYGFGLPGNADTLPSQVGAMVGMPFANVSFPEANTRTLYAVLLDLVVRGKHRPSVVLLVTGGDFTAFCYTGLADPVFGTPTLFSNAPALKERGGQPDVKREFARLVDYTRLWSGAIIDLCRRAGIPLAFGEDVTFFEKIQPTERDIDCELGIARNPAQARQFAVHRALVEAYGVARTRQMQASNVPIGGPGRRNQITYVDEFHYDAPGARSLAEHFAGAMRTAIEQAPKRGAQAASRSTNSG